MKGTMRYCTVLLVVLTAALTTRAQEIVLSATSSKYPLMRGQWSEQQGQEWQEKYGPIIGVNCPYPPCDAMSQEQAIAKAAELGFNSVRWWPSGGTYVDNYIKSVEQWAGWADKYGMTVSPVFSFVDAYYGWEDHDAALKALEEQVRKIFRHFRNDDRIIMWDVWNEPEMWNSPECEEKMDWIEKMALWGQQEGCTQPITSSIIWDTGTGNNTATHPMRTLREKTEARMDLHNYHDYACQDGFNSETRTLVARMHKMDRRILVATECMTRTNGSTYARTFYDFAFYHINFYSWGLYACDANWEVRWGRSTFYNWEPLFHNLLYADGEPYDERDLPRIKNFKFTETNEDPGAEWTEQWTERRAWRWMNRPISQGPIIETMTAAKEFIKAHADEGKYTTIAVRIGSREHAASDLESLLNTAESAGMTVLPILLTSSDLASLAQRPDYVYQIIEKYYSDRRVEGWCLFEQTSEGDEQAIATHLPALFRRARYAFANQPLMAVPYVNGSTVADSGSSDLANLMWRLSDVSAYEGEGLTDEWADGLERAYQRPLMDFSAGDYAHHYAHWTDNNVDGASRMPAWKAWRWMSGTVTKGLAYASLDKALKGLREMESAGSAAPYNSLSVALDYRAFAGDREGLMSNLDSLMNMAGRLGMTVLPQLLTDSYLNMPMSMLNAYVECVLKAYAQDSRIAAWDLYNKVCSTSRDVKKATQVLDELFATARATGAQQPIYATPSVTAKPITGDFDYVDALVHGHSNGWGRLAHGGGDVGLTYHIWCMSDVIAYSSSQTSPHLGWVNAMACKFGRPLFCAEWKPATSEISSKTMDIFEDMHVNWYVNGTLDAESVDAFGYLPVSTGH